MVEVEVIRPFWHDGRPAQAGQVLALDVATAAYVVGLGRAMPVAEARAEPKPKRKPAVRERAA